MNVRAVVPRLNDGGPRDRIWKFCRRYWRQELPEVELIEGHHEGDGPFNRSAAINRAAEGEWEVLVILDADVIVDAGLVMAAAERAAETGSLVLPFERRRMLSVTGTRQILNGYRGSWNRWIAHTERDRVSCCVVVPRALWEAVNRFDERFEGWGGEDEAFYAACRMLGGAERLGGEVWHLHHRPSPHHNHGTPLYRQALQLTHRYKGIDCAAGMRKLLDEPRTTEQIALVALTTGERDTLAPAITSAEENLQGPIGRRLLCVDALAHRVAALAKLYPGWDVVQANGGSYSKTMGLATSYAIGSGQPWIFWLEDDFTFNQPVGLTEMQALMDREPQLAQLALLRQAWFPHEIDAGGVFAAKPDAYTQREGFVEHQDHWTQNPMLMRRSVLASATWPRGASSEKHFGKEIYAMGLTSGYVGALTDDPLVTHIGTDRAGTGY